MRLGCRNLRVFRGARCDDGDSSADMVERDVSVATDGCRSVVRVRRRHRRTATTAPAGDEQLNERVAELLAHRAVQQEVDSVVYQSQNLSSALWPSCWGDRNSVRPDPDIPKGFSLRIVPKYGVGQEGWAGETEKKESGSLSEPECPVDLQDLRILRRRSQ